MHRHLIKSAAVNIEAGKVFQMLTADTCQLCK